MLRFREKVIVSVESKEVEEEEEQEQEQGGEDDDDDRAFDVHMRDTSYLPLRDVENELKDIARMESNGMAAADVDEGCADAVRRLLREDIVRALAQRPKHYRLEQRFNDAGVKLMLQSRDPYNRLLRASLAAELFAAHDFERNAYERALGYTDAENEPRGASIDQTVFNCINEIMKLVAKEEHDENASRRDDDGNLRRIETSKNLLSALTAKKSGATYKHPSQAFKKLILSSVSGEGAAVTRLQNRLAFLAGDNTRKLPPVKLFLPFYAATTTLKTAKGGATKRQMTFKERLDGLAHVSVADVYLLGKAAVAVDQVYDKQKTKQKETPFKLLLLREFLGGLLQGIRSMYVTMAVPWSDARVKGEFMSRAQAGESKSSTATDAAKKKQMHAAFEEHFVLADTAPYVVGLRRVLCPYVLPPEQAPSDGSVEQQFAAFWQDKLGIPQDREQALALFDASLVRPKVSERESTWNNKHGIVLQPLEMSSARFVNLCEALYKLQQAIREDVNGPDTDAYRSERVEIAKLILDAQECLYSVVEAHGEFLNPKQEEKYRNEEMEAFAKLAAAAEEQNEHTFAELEELREKAEAAKEDFSPLKHRSYAYPYGTQLTLHNLQLLLTDCISALAVEALEGIGGVELDSDELSIVQIPESQVPSDAYAAQLAVAVTARVFKSFAAQLEKEGIQVSQVLGTLVYLYKMNKADRKRLKLDELLEKVREAVEKDQEQTRERLDKEEAAAADAKSKAPEASANAGGGDGDMDEDIV